MAWNSACSYLLYLFLVSISIYFSLFLVHFLYVLVMYPASTPRTKLCTPCTPDRGTLAGYIRNGLFRPLSMHIVVSRFSSILVAHSRPSSSCTPLVPRLQNYVPRVPWIRVHWQGTLETAYSDVYVRNCLFCLIS